MAVSEEEVKKSFARAREDILQVKRSLNKQLFSIEGLQKSLSGSLEKEEFYAFVKRLGSRIEEIESSFAAKSDKEDISAVSSELRSELSGLHKLIERREELADEIRQARALRGKVLELEGLLLSRPEFAKEAAKLKGEIAGLKSAASVGGSEVSSLSSSVSRLAGSISQVESKLNSLSAKAAAKEEISAFMDRIESSHREVLRSFSALKRDVDKRVSILDSVEERLSSLSEKVSSADARVGVLAAAQGGYAEKSSVEKAISGLKAQLGDTRKLLESSISEVNMDDYVTRRSLKQQLSSVSESAVSAVSSRLGEIQDQLGLLKEQLDSAQKDAGKKIDRELHRFAEVKEVKRLGDELQKMESKFIPAGDFYSKLQRIEEASAHSSDDFRKELKRQREIFEERVKSLEAHHRSAADSFKSEMDQLRLQVKGLSKADEQAKTEMAKISVTAAKAAAKTATEILEEVERESPERRRPGKGLSAVAVFIAIIALVVLGSLAFFALKGPGGEGQNQALPELPIAPAVPSANVSGGEILPPAAELPAKNVSPAAPYENAGGASPVIVPSSNASSLPALAANVSEVARDRKCRDELECTKRDGGEYWFDCYFDNASHDCKCYVGSINDCPQLLVENESANASAEPREEAGEKGRPGARYFGIVIFIIAVVTFLAYRVLFVRDEGAVEEAESHPAAKKAGKPAEKPKAKESESASGEGGDKDVIDLEEFFEKKDAKKK